MFNKYGRVRGSRLPLTQSVVLNCGGALSCEGRGRFNKRRGSRPCHVTVSDEVRLARAAAATTLYNPHGRLWAFLNPSRGSAPTKEEWALRVISVAAGHTSAGHLRPLLLRGRGDLGDVAGSCARRGWFGCSLNGQLLCLDDRRRGRRPKHLGYSCRWRASLRFAGWRFEIHTPGEEQQGQQRAHIEKILEDRHWADPIARECNRNMRQRCCSAGPSNLNGLSRLP